MQELEPKPRYDKVWEEAMSKVDEIQPAENIFLHHAKSEIGYYQVNHNPMWLSRALENILHYLELVQETQVQEQRIQVLPVRPSGILSADTPGTVERPLASSMGIGAALMASLGATQALHLVEAISAYSKSHHSIPSSMVSVPETSTTLKLILMWPGGSGQATEEAGSSGVADREP